MLSMSEFLKDNSAVFLISDLCLVDKVLKGPSSCSNVSCGYCKREKLKVIKSRQIFEKLNQIIRLIEEEQTNRKSSAFAQITL